MKCLVFFNHSYTYVTHQQMHSDKIYFIIYYYLPICYGSSATIIRVSHKKINNIQHLHKLHNQTHPMLQYSSMPRYETYKILKKKKIYIYKKRTSRTMNITTYCVEVMFPQMEDTFPSFV
jgi:hypothetical protein